MLTALIHEPGSIVIRIIHGNRRQTIVKDGQVLVACQACEYSCSFPERLRNQAETVRQWHLRTVHWTDQLEGRVCIDPELVDLDEPLSIHPSLQGF